MKSNNFIQKTRFALVLFVIIFQCNAQNIIANNLKESPIKGGFEMKDFSINQQKNEL